MADPCPHTTCDSQVTWELIEPANGLTPYYQAAVRIWCQVCAGVLMPTGLPVQDPALFRTVALAPDGETVYLSGLVVVPEP